MNNYRNEGRKRWHLRKEGKIKGRREGGTKGRKEGGIKRRKN